MDKNAESHHSTLIKTKGEMWQVRGGMICQTDSIAGKSEGKSVLDSFMSIGQKTMTFSSSNGEIMYHFLTNYGMVTRESRYNRSQSSLQFNETAPQLTETDVTSG